MNNFNAMKIIKFLLLMLAIIFSSVFISLLITQLILFISKGSSIILGVKSSLVSFLIILVIILSLSTIYLIFKNISNIKISKMMSYTLIYWFFHPLIERPIKSIKYLFYKKEKNIDYISNLSKGPSILKNNEMNNSKHRLNYLNFINKVITQNNKILFSINLKQEIIKQSFANEQLILGSKYKINLEEIPFIKDDFSKRRNFLNNDQINFKYKKESKNILITFVMLMFTSLTFILSLASLFISPILSLILASVLFVELLCLSFLEYGTIINSKIIVNRKNMERLKRQILYDIKNLVKLQDSLNGLLSSNYEQVVKFIDSIDDENELKIIYKNYVELFGGENIQREKDKKIENNLKEDELIKEKQKKRIDEISNKNRKNLRRNYE